MTRTGALVWKEWRDHRAAAFVFAALVPLVSWPVQRWVFKFAEPEWTWKWMVPLCVGLAVAVIASDAFAMDLATSRMNSFVALPVTLRRHFGARVTFLAFVAAAMAVWAAAANLAIVECWGQAGAVALHLAKFESAKTGLLMTAAGAAAVLVLSSLGIGGFRAVFGGATLAAVASFATTYAAGRLVPVSAYEPYVEFRPQVEWMVAAAVLFVAAYVGFVGGRANAASRERGVVLASVVLVAAFGVPAAGATWKAYRGWLIDPDDPELYINGANASPDGRYVAIFASKYGGSGAHRSWIARVDGGPLIDWPRRNEGLGGWTDDGLVWSVAYDRPLKPSSWGRLVRPETGETVSSVSQADLETRLTGGLSSDGPRWAQWLRRRYEPTNRHDVSTWTLRSKDGGPERVVEARSCPTPTRTVGTALIATPANRLALVDLAGGDPRVVAEDVVSIGGASACSPDGRYVIVGTSKGDAVIDSADWSVAFGPVKSHVSWCGRTGERSVVCVVDAKSYADVRLVDVKTRREIVPELRYYYLDSVCGSVQALPDGRFVAHASWNRIVLLDADGKFIRRLFPPEE
jgi:hypothetical protein